MLERLRLRLKMNIMNTCRYVGKTKNEYNEYLQIGWKD